MKKKIIAFGGISLCCILMVAAIFMLFITEGQDAWRMNVIYVGLFMFSLHSCYRINKYRKAGGKTSSVIETELKLHQVNSISGFLRVFFAPEDMRFRTSLGLFLLVVFGCVGRYFWFWMFLLLLVAAKALLAFQYYRYWKAWHGLNNNDEIEEEKDFDEEAVREFTDVLKSHEHKAIGICFDDAENAPKAIGCSKYGGQPDVPDGFQWPKDDENRPLSLLLQIDCRDLASVDTERLLPTSGHLYFFYELDEQNWDGTENSVRVIYEETENKELHRADFPTDLFDGYRLNEKPLSFAVQNSYPSWDDFICKCPKYDVSYDVADTVKEKLDSEQSYDTIGSMLGWADLIQGNIVEDTDDNVLLLQLKTIESDDADELMFGDCGTIYFYISRQDLKNKRFDRIKFELQCY